MALKSAPPTPTMTMDRGEVLASMMARVVLSMSLHWPLQGTRREGGQERQVKVKRKRSRLQSAGCFHLQIPERMTAPQMHSAMQANYSLSEQQQDGVF